MLPRRGDLGGSRVVLIEGGLFLVEQLGNPRRGEVDNVAKDEPGDFAGF